MNRFLVAKFAPDLSRMEPRNFGVILWAGGKVAMRFKHPTAVDGLQDVENYQRWITHWKTLVESKRIRVKNRQPRTIRSQAFLDELLLTQKGNYILVDAGEILCDVNDINDAADFLYRELVL